MSLPHFQRSFGFSPDWSENYHDKIYDNRFCSSSRERKHMDNWQHAYITYTRTTLEKPILSTTDIGFIKDKANSLLSQFRKIDNLSKYIYSQYKGIFSSQVCSPNNFWLSFRQSSIAKRYFNIWSAHGTDIQLFGAQCDSLLSEAKVKASVYGRIWTWAGREGGGYLDRAKKAE